MPSLHYMPFLSLLKVLNLRKQSRGKDSIKKESQSTQCQQHYGENELGHGKKNMNLEETTVPILMRSWRKRQQDGLEARPQVFSRNNGSGNGEPKQKHSLWTQMRHFITLSRAQTRRQIQKLEAQSEQSTTKWTRTDGDQNTKVTMTK